MVMRLHPLLAPLPLVLVSGCSALPTPVVLNGDAVTFKGMSALAGEAAPGRPLHVLLVHGMGTPTPNGFDPFIASLAGRFGLVQIPPHDPQAQWQGCYSKTTPGQPALVQPTPEPIDNTAVFRDNRALLYTYNFAARPADPPSSR